MDCTQWDRWDAQVVPDVPVRVGLPWRHGIRGTPVRDLASFLVGLSYSGLMVTVIIRSPPGNTEGS
jgi:hypothetical protein